MAVSILAILAAFAGGFGLLFMWWVKRRTSTSHDIQKQRDENREAIADGSAGDLLEQRLTKLPPSSGKGH